LNMIRIEQAPDEGQLALILGFQQFRHDGIPTSVND
jgi:hypothetical protein